MISRCSDALVEVVLRGAVLSEQKRSYAQEDHPLLPGHSHRAAGHLGDRSTEESRIKGCSRATSKGVWLYQLTDDGLAVELTAKGTKYYRDDDLN